MGQVNFRAVAFLPSLLHRRSGVAFIHHVGVAHRDLKCENILVKKELALRIADFGSASSFEPSQRFCNIVGSLTNLAPESLPAQPGDQTSSQSYRPAPVDIWATGVTLYEVFAGLPPFRSGTLKGLFVAIQNGTEDPMFFNSFDMRLAVTIDMLARNPHQRVSAVEALHLLERALQPQMMPARKRRRQE